jgi:DNA damage-binding protein 1
MFSLFTVYFIWQDKNKACHMKTYEMDLEDEGFSEGPWSQNNLGKWMNLLIPVPPPLCGVLITGGKTIVYCSTTAFEAIPSRPVCLYISAAKIYLKRKRSKGLHM